MDTLLAMSEEILSESTSRRNMVSDKCKTLLTLGSLLLGLVGLLLPKYLAFDSLWMRVLSVLAVAILFNAILILLVFFDVGQEMSVTLTQGDVGLDELNLKKSLLNRRLMCWAATQNRTDYLVEIYRAARFCFLSALALVAVLVFVGLMVSNPADQTERVVREIRSHPDLIKLLRGPKGEDGRDATVNFDEVVKRAIVNPQFQRAIEMAVSKTTTRPSKP